MPTLLHLDSSPLPTSVTRELGREFVQTWKKSHPEGAVIYRDLATLAPKPLDAQWIASAYTPETARTEEQKAALALSDELVAELELADEYVIGVAMHNFSIPSVLKLWIDQIARVGRTFSYSETGPQGMLLDKKVTLLIASGGKYDAGTPASALDFVEPYLRAVFRFVGISELNVITASGTSALMSGKIDREKFLEPTLGQVRQVAA